MEKRRCAYDLNSLKNAFADPARMIRTNEARKGALALGMDDDMVVDAIQSLVYPRDFDKSMTASHDSKLWQDVYKPVYKGRRLYVKFTLNAVGRYLLISFKEA